MTRYQTSHLHRPPGDDCSTDKLTYPHRASEEDITMDTEDAPQWFVMKLIGQEKEIDHLRTEMEKLQKFVRDLPVSDRTLHTSPKEKRLLTNQNIATVQRLSVSNENNLDKTGDDTDINAQIDVSNNSTDICARKSPWLQSDGNEAVLMYGYTQQDKYMDTADGDILHERNYVKVINDGTNRCADEDDDYEQLCVSIAVGTDVSKDERMTIKTEYVKLRRQLNEVLKVNNAWDQFWSRKKSSFESLLKEKDTIIAKLRNSEGEIKNTLQTANVEKEQALKDKDEMLLLTKARIIKLEDIIDKLQKDHAENSQKNERAQKFARGLLQQRQDLEHEVKRLNKILETNTRQQQQTVNLLQNNPSVSSGQQKSHANLSSDAASSGQPAKSSKDKTSHGQSECPAKSSRDTTSSGQPKRPSKSGRDTTSSGQPKSPSKSGRDTTSSGQPKSPAKSSRDRTSSGQPKNADKTNTDNASSGQPTCPVIKSSRDKSRRRSKPTSKQDKKTPDKKEVRQHGRIEMERNSKAVQETKRQGQLDDNIREGQEENEGVSLTKEELKEQLVFLQEQTDAYKSDFRKERSDRERVVGQLEYVKEKLDRTKQKLSQSNHRNPTMAICGPCVISRHHIVQL